MAKKSDSLYIASILDAIRQIEEYIQSTDETGFMTNRLIQDAVIRQLEIIGEAARQVSDSGKTGLPGIPWKVMAGMRDKLIHDYLGVDLKKVWNTVIRDIPVLKIELSKQPYSGNR